MEHSFPLLIATIIAAAIILGFVIYRNIKDEKEFEHDADAEKEHEHHHPLGEEEEKNT